MNMSSPVSSRSASAAPARLPLFRTAGLAAALVLPLFSASPASATVATADTIGGYSTQVLAQILQVWREPMGAREK